MLFVLPATFSTVFSSYDLFIPYSLSLLPSLILIHIYILLWEDFSLPFLFSELEERQLLPIVAIILILMSP